MIVSLGASTKLKFRKIGVDENDTIIICVDGRNSWRKDYEKTYKANRNEQRAKSGLDWDTLFKQFNELLLQLDKATDFGKENDELEELGFFYADIDGYDGAAQILKMIFNLDKDEPDNLLPSLEGKEAIKIDGKRKDFLYLKQDVEDNCVDKKLLLKEIERYPEEHTRMKSKLKSIFGL